MLPYTMRKAFATQDNVPEGVTLGVPSRGIIKNIVIVQTSGPNEGFSFELFTNRDVFPPDGPTTEGGVVYESLPSGSSMSLSSEGPTGGVQSSSSAGSTPPASLFSVFGRKTAAGQEFSEFEKNYIYTCEGGSTNRGRKLYLKIMPVGAGNDVKTFEMKIDIALAGMLQ